MLRWVELGIEKQTACAQVDSFWLEKPNNTKKQEAAFVIQL
jgi:hypothetical protein